MADQTTISFVAFLPTAWYCVVSSTPEIDRWQLPRRRDIMNFALLLWIRNRRSPVPRISTFVSTLGLKNELDLWCSFTHCVVIQDTATWNAPTSGVYPRGTKLAPVASPPATTDVLINIAEFPTLVLVGSVICLLCFCCFWSFHFRVTLHQKKPLLFDNLRGEDWLIYWLKHSIWSESWSLSGSVICLWSCCCFGAFTSNWLVTRRNLLDAITNLKVEITSWGSYIGLKHSI
jgi:hypothetical protein